MNQQELVAKREPDEDDKSFCKLENIKFMDDKELKDFYNNMKCQMIVVVLGIILFYTNKIKINY